MVQPEIGGIIISDIFCTTKIHIIVTFIILFSTLCKKNELNKILFPKVNGYLLYKQRLK